MSGAGYQGPERRAPRVEPVSRSEFVEFSHQLDRRLSAQDERLQHGAEVMAKLNTAMFAETEENEFQSPGVMTVMRKINAHVDMMCNFAAGIRKFGQFLMWAAGVAGALAGLGAAAKASGLL